MDDSIYGEGWADEPHECQCSGPDDSCPACSELTSAAAVLGRKGGRSRSEAKIRAGRENVKKAVAALANRPPYRRGQTERGPVELRVRETDEFAANVSLRLHLRTVPLGQVYAYLNDSQWGPGWHPTSRETAYSDQTRDQAIDSLLHDWLHAILAVCPHAL